MTASAFDTSSNWSLKEEIRSHWTTRSATFDQAFGHRIPPGPERDAWLATIRRHLGDEPLRVLDVACGTGEVTGVLLELGHTVTGLDFSEAMVERARAKHRDNRRARFLLGDAEGTLEADGTYDAVVCRHLVWTLTDPGAALRDWHRVLRPGGRLLVFDGDFVNLPRRGRIAKKAMTWIARWAGPDRHRDGSLDEQHARILRELPFSGGLTGEALMDLAREAGFGSVSTAPYDAISRGQRRAARSASDWLRTWLHTRFILVAVRP